MPFFYNTYTKGYSQTRPEKFLPLLEKTGCDLEGNYFIQIPGTPWQEWNAGTPARLFHNPETKRVTRDVPDEVAQIR